MSDPNEPQDDLPVPAESPPEEPGDGYGLPLWGWVPSWAGRNPRTTVGIIALVVAALVGVFLLLAARGRGAPGVPRALIAEGKACGPPECKRLAVAIDLHWEPPTKGGEVTVYRLYRDGRFVTEIGSLSTDYQDRDVAIGEIHSYQLQALGPQKKGDLSYPAKGRVPEPPVVSAQLSGDYDVLLTVKAAKHFPGKDRPGDQEAVRWGFRPKCKATASACTTVVDTMRTTLRFTGKGYEGPVAIRGVRDLAAKARGLHGAILLTPTEAAADGSGWRVTSFEGIETVRSGAKGILRISLVGTAR